MVKDERLKVDKNVIKNLSEYYGKNRDLLHSEIIKILENHFIPYYEKNERIFVLEEYKNKSGKEIREEIEVTGIDKLHLLAYLGY